MKEGIGVIIILLSIIGFNFMWMSWDLSEIKQTLREIRDKLNENVK